MSGENLAQFVEQSEILSQEGRNFNGRAEAMLQEIEHKNYTTLLDIYLYIAELSRIGKITQSVSDEKLARLNEVSERLTGYKADFLYSCYFPHRFFNFELKEGEYEGGYSVNTGFGEGYNIGQVQGLPNGDIIAAIDSTDLTKVGSASIQKYTPQGERQEIASLPYREATFLSLSDGQIISANGLIVSSHKFNGKTGKWDKGEILDFGEMDMELDEGAAHDYVILESLDNNRFLIKGRINSTFVAEFKDGNWKVEELKIKGEHKSFNSNFMRAVGPNHFYNINRYQELEFVEIHKDNTATKKRILSPGKAQMIEPLPEGGFVVVEPNGTFRVSNGKSKTMQALQYNGIDFRYTKMPRLLKSIGENQVLVNDNSSVYSLNLDKPHNPRGGMKTNFNAADPAINILANGDIICTTNDLRRGRKIESWITVNRVNDD